MPRVPKYAPPPIPMPHSERTIYVHVENEQPVLKAGQDPPKLIEIQGKTVMISSLAQKEIENAAKQIEPTVSYTVTPLLCPTIQVKFNSVVKADKRIILHGHQTKTSAFTWNFFRN